MPSWTPSTRLTSRRSRSSPTRRSRATRSTCRACWASTTPATAWSSGGVGPETAQSFRHVERILAACDASLADIVKVSVYMPDLGEWEAMNAAYLDVFGARPPARIAVGCASLLFGARVEFDCVAFRG